MDMQNWVWFAGILILAVLIDWFVMPGIFAFLRQRKKPARQPSRGSYLRRVIPWLALVGKNAWGTIKKGFKTGLNGVSTTSVALVATVRSKRLALDYYFSKRKTQSVLPAPPVKVDNPPPALPTTVAKVDNLPHRQIINQVQIEPVKLTQTVIVTPGVKANPTQTRSHVEISVSLAAGQLVKITVESNCAQDDKKAIK